MYKKLFLICLSVLFLNFPAIAEPPDNDGCPWGYKRGYSYHGYGIEKSPCEKIRRRPPSYTPDPDSIYNNPYKWTPTTPKTPPVNLYPNRPKRRYGESTAQYNKRYEKYAGSRGGGCFISTVSE